MKVGKASRNIVLKFINKFGISLACNHWNSQITFSSSLADYDLSPLEIQRWWLIWASNTVFHSLSVAHIEVAVFTGVKFLVIIPSSKFYLTSSYFEAKEQPVSTCSSVTVPLLRKPKAPSHQKSWDISHGPTFLLRNRYWTPGLWLLMNEMS